MYVEVILGHVVCPLYGGCPYLGESVMGGSTACMCVTMDGICYLGRAYSGH